MSSVDLIGSNKQVAGIESRWGTNRRVAYIVQRYKTDYTIQILYLLYLQANKIGKIIIRNALIHEQLRLLREENNGSRD